MLYNCDFRVVTFVLLNRLQHFVTKHTQKFGTLIQWLRHSWKHGWTMKYNLWNRKVYNFCKFKMVNGYLLLVKNIFMHKLFTCMSDNENRIGFIPEIMNILGKFCNQSDFLTNLVIIPKMQTFWRNHIGNVL